MALPPGPPGRILMTLAVLALLVVGVYAALEAIPRAQRPTLINPTHQARHH